MIIFIIVIAMIAAGIILYEIPKPKKRESKKRKYQIPPSFWDDYNHCLHSIHKMKETDTQRVENLIDNLMYQYLEMLEYCVYIEKMSNLVDQYNKKIKSLVLTNNLN